MARRGAGSTSHASSSHWPPSSWPPSCWASSPNGSDSRPSSASSSPACCSAAACSASCRPDGAPGELIHVLAELGVLLLLFEIGLETDLREMFRVGPASLAVAVGRASCVPFALGLRLLGLLPHPATGAGDLTTAAIFIGATLTATSVGITARVLPTWDGWPRQEARIIIGAAVIDDVLGLVILSVVSGVAAGGAVTALRRRAHARRGGRLPGGRGPARALPGAAPVRCRRPDAGALRARGLRRRVRARACPPWPPWPARRSSSAPSPPGLILSGTNQFDTIEQEIRPVASVFTPIFFVSVGASVNLRPARPDLAAPRVARWRSPAR